MDSYVQVIHVNTVEISREGAELQCITYAHPLPRQLQVAVIALLQLF